MFVQGTDAETIKQQMCDQWCMSHLRVREAADFGFLSTDADDDVDAAPPAAAQVHRNHMMV